MEELVTRGFRSARLAEYGASSLSHVLLTFDDAYAHVGDAVTPILRWYGFTAVMFAPWRHLGGRNTWDLEHKNLCKLEISTGDQLAEMARGPWEIASHGMWHEDLTREEPAQRLKDLVESREKLSDLVHRPVTGFAYPYGRHNASVREDARRAGYQWAFTDGRGNYRDPFRLPRRPISGTDGVGVFRLKTSRLFDRFGLIRGLAPEWTKSTARRIVDLTGAR
jgi:peptidoglycan/xylan/chitin deacetylase (PgdA/CDA1 family)